MDTTKMGLKVMELVSASLERCSKEGAVAANRNLIDHCNRICLKGKNFEFTELNQWLRVTNFQLFGTRS